MGNGLLGSKEAGVVVLIFLIAWCHFGCIEHHFHLKSPVDDEVSKFFEMSAFGRIASIWMALPEPASLAKYFIGFEATVFQIILMLRVTLLKLINTHADFGWFIILLDSLIIELLEQCLKKIVNPSLTSTEANPNRQKSIKLVLSSCASSKWCSIILILIRAEPLIHKYFLKY